MKLSIKYWLPVAAFAILPLHEASATDTVALDAITVTATMIPKKVVNAPGAIEIITAEQIKMQGAETLDEVLGDALGLSINMVSGRGQIPQIRGLSNKRVLILIDGMRSATGFRGTTVDLSEFSTEFVERIEIVRGPSSSLYGSEAMGGVINIITKKPPAEFTGYLTTRYGINTYGEANNFVVKGTAGSTFGKLGVAVMGHSNVTDDFDRRLDDAFGSDIDEEDRYSGGIKFNLDLTEQQQITAGIYYNETTREGLRSGDRHRHSESQRINNFLQYDVTVADFTVMLRGYASYFELDRYYLRPGRPRMDLKIENDIYQIEGRISRMFGDKHLLLLGVEYREEERDGIENRDEIASNRTTHNNAVFLQNDFALTDTIQIVAGIRLDDNSDFGSKTSPRISMIYSMMDNLRIRASYGESFRVPSMYELYIENVTGRGRVRPNPNLTEEEAKSYEIGIEGEFGRFAGGIMLFRNDIDDMILRVQTGTERFNRGRSVRPVFDMQNVREVRTEGVELEMRIDLPWHLNLAGNTSFISTENKQTGGDLSDVPEMKSHLRLAYDNKAIGLKGNIRMNYIGRQLRVQPGNSHATESAGSTTVDMYVSKIVMERFELFAGIDNVFNKIIEHWPNRGGFYYSGLKVHF